MYEATWTLLTPSNVLVMLLVIALLAAWLRWHALSTGLLGLVVLAFLAITLLPVGTWVATPLEDAVEAPPLPASVDGVIVLGGSVEWRVTEARGQIALDGAGERMLAALALAGRYPDAELVFTGLYADALRGSWTDTSGRDLPWQPAFEGHELRFLGAAASTYEEALMAKNAVQPTAGQTWLLVTSALHMPRALATFRANGWDVVPFPVDYRTTGRVAWRFDPRVGARLEALDRAVREWGALWVYRRTGRIADPW